MPHAMEDYQGGFTRGVSDLGESVWREGGNVLETKRGTERLNLIGKSKDMERFAEICAINENYKQYSNPRMNLL